MSETVRYAWTGEFREPNIREWFLFEAADPPQQAESDYPADSKYWILRPEPVGSPRETPVPAPPPPTPRGRNEALEHAAREFHLLAQLPEPGLFTWCDFYEKKKRALVAAAFGVQQPPAPAPTDEELGHRFEVLQFAARERSWAEHPDRPVPVAQHCAALEAAIRLVRECLANQQPQPKEMP